MGVVMCFFGGYPHLIFRKISHPENFKIATSQSVQWSTTSDLPNSKNCEADLIKVSAVVQKAVLVLELLSAVLMS